MKYIFLISIIFWSCNSATKQEATQSSAIDTTTQNVDSTVNAVTLVKKDLREFLPAGFILFDSAAGDLNKDGIADQVLIIKGTDKKNVVKDEYKGVLDRNRRGIIVLFNNSGNYEVAVKNYDCFSSENEDGGVYFAPELSVTIGNGKLFINYGHGRYGDWTYTFRYQNGDFEQIGFDANSGNGPVINKVTSINYLTKKKSIKENTNENAEGGGDEVYKEIIKTIRVNKLRRLSEIKDFDELDNWEE